MSCPAPGFAVVGAGRSGTGYVAAVLRAHGVDCGHEAWWRPDGTGERTPGLAGDVSWLALPDIESGAWQGPVALVVRNPVDTVQSLMGTRLFDPAANVTDVTLAYRAFAYAHMPALVGLDPLRAAVEWWAGWNERCAAVADVSIRVEDLTRHAWALAELGAALGVALDPAVVATVPTLTNHRERGTEDAGEIWRLLAGRADPFGYPRHSR